MKSYEKVKDQYCGLWQLEEGTEELRKNLRGPVVKSDASNQILYA